MLNDYVDYGKRSFRSYQHDHVDLSKRGEKEREMTNCLQYSRENLKIMKIFY